MVTHCSFKPPSIATVPSRLFAFAVATLIALSFPSGLSAQSDWQFLGLQDDESTCCLKFLTIFPHDSRSLVAGPSGIASEDGGDSWIFTESRPAAALQGLEISRANPDIRYRWTSSRTERSVDGGQTWLRIAPLPATGGAVVANPYEPNLVYVRSRGNLQRSADAGLTWTTLPAEPDIDLVATGRARLLWIDWPELRLSLDNGDTSLKVLSDIRLLAQDPSDPSKLAALRINRFGSSASRQILHSQNGGESWTDGAILPPEVSRVDGLALDAEGTVFMTTDASLWRHPSGGSFEHSDVPRASYPPNQVYPSAAELLRVYGLFGGSLHRSDNGGQSFSQVRFPTRSTPFVFPRAHSPLALAGGDVYRDSAGNWNASTGWPRFGSQVIAAGSALFTSKGPVFRSRDDGATWEALPGGAQSSIAGLTALANDTRDQPTLFTIEADTLRRSTDLGDNWQILSSSHENDAFRLGIEITTFHDGTAFKFATRDTSHQPFRTGRSYTVRESLDGATWTLVHSPEVANRSIEKILYSPLGDLVLLASGILYRRLAGKWKNSSPPGDSFRVRQVLAPKESMDLFAVDDSGLWIDRASAGRWELLVADGPALGFVTIDVPNQRLLSSSAQGIWELNFQECGANADSLCLADRFHTTATYSVADEHAPASPLPITSDTGAFWFFEPDNLEVLVKVLDGCAINGHYWVFAAGLTDVATGLDILDAETGRRWHHETSPGTPFAPVQDTTAIPCN